MKSARQGDRMAANAASERDEPMLVRLNRVIDRADRVAARYDEETAAIIFRARAVLCEMRRDATDNIRQSA